MFFLLMLLALHRLILIGRIGELVRKTKAPEWKAWWLSAVEPFVTASLASVWVVVWFMFFITEFDEVHEPIITDDSMLVLWYGMVVILVCNLALFARSIRKVGQLSPQSRFALETIYVRLGLVVLSTLFGLLGYFNETIFSLPFYTLSIAFIIRFALSIYQTIALTKNRESLEKEHHLIEDGGADEQVALIERLKAEEVIAGASPDQVQAIADQMVAEKNITVGRAKELL